MNTQSAQLAAVSEDSDRDSTLGSFFLTRDGQMMPKQSPPIPLLRPSNPDSRLEESALHQASEVLRSVHLWGNQKGFKLEAKREATLFAATLNRINDERDRFLSKSPLKQQSLTTAAAPAPYSPAKQPLRLVKHMDEVDFSNVDIVFQPPPQPVARANRRRSTVQTGLHFITVPDPKPKALYEPPPACNNIRKFLQNSTSAELVKAKLELVRAKSELVRGKLELVRAKSELKAPLKRDLTEPSSPLKLTAKLPALRKQPKKLSVVTTKSSSPLGHRSTNSPLLPSPILPTKTGQSFFKVRQVLTDRL